MPAKYKETRENEITVELGGTWFTVPRGDMDDEQWSALKADLQKQEEESSAKSGNVTFHKGGKVKAGPPQIAERVSTTPMGYAASEGPGVYVAQKRAQDHLDEGFPAAESVRMGPVEENSRIVAGNVSYYPTDEKGGEVRVEVGEPTQLARKAQPSSIRVKVGDSEIDVPRRDMTDDQWAELQEAMRSEGRLVEKPTEVASNPLAGKGKGFGPLGFVRDAFQDATVKATPYQPRPGAGADNAPPLRTNVPVREPDGRVAELVAQDQEILDNQPYISPETNAEIDRRFAEMRQNPKITPSSTAPKAAPAFDEPAPQLVEQPIDENQRKSMRDLLERQGLRPAPMQMGQPPQPGEYTPQDVDALVRSGGREWAPGSGVTPEQQRSTTGVMAPGTAPGYQPPVGAGGVQLAPPPQDPAQLRREGAAAALSAVGGPATGLPKSRMGAMERKIEEAYRNQSAAESRAADLLEQRFQREGQLQQDEAARQRGAQEDIQRVFEERQKAQENALSAYQSTIKQMGEVAKIDPNRLWNNMSTGHKVMAGVGLLLSGLGNAASGQAYRNNALDMIRDAIKQDIATQQQDIENNRAAMRDRASEQFNAYQALREQGLDKISAMKGQEAALIQAAIQEIEGISSTLQAPEARAKAEAAIQALGVDLAKAQADMVKHEDQFAIQRAELANQQMKIRVEAIHKLMGGGGEGKQIPAATAMELAKFQSASDVAQKLQATFKDKGAGFLSKFTSWFPGTGATEYNAARDIALATIGRMIDGSVLQSYDLVRWEKMIPEAGDLKGKEKLEALVRDVVDTYNSRVAMMRQTGYDVSQVPRAGLPPGVTPVE